MSHPRLCTLLVLVCLGSISHGQTVISKKRIPTGGPPCPKQTAIEFIAPMPTEHIPVFHGAMPHSWHVSLEIATQQIPGVEITPIFEALFQPSPGGAAIPPTDVNGDLVLGDPHPAIPGLTLVVDDDLFHIPTGVLVPGTIGVPGGTNLASLMEMIGSEIEHGLDQSTQASWLVDALTWMIIDVDGSGTSTLTATINGITDTVTVVHTTDPVFATTSTENPTVSIWVTDWISTVDSMVSTGETAFMVGVEVRIPCWFDSTTTPPTPTPLDPVFGPCGGLACTGFFPPIAGPGFNPMFPSVDVRFSDDYFDTRTGTFVPGGVITGGACGVIWGATGASLAYAFQQSSVHAWFGVNGIPDTTPLGGGDDQLIYRFTMLADGDIFDTDVLPGEMMVTAAVEVVSNCFSITNVRVKHRPDVKTPNPGP